MNETRGAHPLFFLFCTPDADDWNRASYEMKRNPFGTFEITIPPNEKGEAAIKHDSKIKVSREA
jgi:hypothetical protein